MFANNMPLVNASRALVITIGCAYNVFGTTKQIPETTICCYIQTSPLPSLFEIFVATLRHFDVLINDNRVLHWSQKLRFPKRCSLPGEAMQESLSAQISEKLLWRMYAQHFLFGSLGMIRLE